MWQEIEIVGYPIELIAKCLSLHFILGFVVAFLLCVWILTIFSVEGARMYRYLFWLCVSAAIVSHVLEDYLIGWF